MPKFELLRALVLTAILSSSIGVPDAFAQAADEEIVHSIYEYDFEYQERARSVAAEMMSHWRGASYVRWRPVRVIPREVLQQEIPSDNAIPESLQITVFPDLIVSAQKTDYFYDKATGGAIWSGVIPGFDLSGVQISIVDRTNKLMKPEEREERIAFVIKIWNPPRHYSILPTDDLDVYVAIEGPAYDDTNK